MSVFSAPQAVFLFSLIKYKPLKYNNSYVYPPWGYVVGWLMALSSMVCVPLYAIFILLKTKGSLKQVLRLWLLGKLLPLSPDGSWEGPQERRTWYISPLRRQREWEWPSLRMTHSSCWQFGGVGESQHSFQGDHQMYTVSHRSCILMLGAICRDMQRVSNAGSTDGRVPVHPRCALHAATGWSVRFMVQVVLLAM